MKKKILFIFIFLFLLIFTQHLFSNKLIPKAYASACIFPPPVCLPIIGCHDVPFVPCLLDAGDILDLVTSAPKLAQVAAIASYDQLNSSLTYIENHIGDACPTAFGIFKYGPHIGQYQMMSLIQQHGCTVASKLIPQLATMTYGQLDEVFGYLKGDACSDILGLYKYKPDKVIGQQEIVNLARKYACPDTNHGGIVPPSGEGGGGGREPECAVDSDCATSNTCQTGDCINVGICKYHNRSSGTACLVNGVSGTCNGTGSCNASTPPVNSPPPGGGGGGNPVTGSISADPPNCPIPAGQSTCSTKITWSISSNTNWPIVCIDHVWFTDNHFDSDAVAPWITARAGGHTFTLFDNGCDSNALASVTVTGQTQNNPPITVGGKVTSSTGTGIPNVSIQVYDDTNNQQTQTAITDSSGNWSISNFVRKEDGYAVRVPNIAPSGYIGGPKTTTSGWNVNHCTKADTPLSSSSYECQKAGTFDCAGPDGNGTSQRCNFAYSPASSTPIPSTTPSTYTISGAVFVDTNNDGVKNGAEVNYTATTPTIKIGATNPITNSGGAYTFTNLAGNLSYDVELTVPSGYVYSYTGASKNYVNPRSVPVLTTNVSGINFGIKSTAPTSAPTPTPTTDPALCPNGTVTGKVFYDNNPENGRFDQGEQLVDLINQPPSSNRANIPMWNNDTGIAVNEDLSGGLGVYKKYNIVKNNKGYRLRFIAPLGYRITTPTAPPWIWIMTTKSDGRKQVDYSSLFVPPCNPTFDFGIRN